MGDTGEGAALRSASLRQYVSAKHLVHARHCSRTCGIGQWAKSTGVSPL